MINDAAYGQSLYSHKPYFFSQQIIFFFHNKSANNTFNHDLLAKRTGQYSRYQKERRSEELPALISSEDLIAGGSRDMQ